jgi:hypothetical protein
LVRRVDDKLMVRSVGAGLGARVGLRTSYFFSVRLSAPVAVDKREARSGAFGFSLDFTLSCHWPGYSFPPVKGLFAQLSSLLLLISTLR